MRCEYVKDCYEKDGAVVVVMEYIGQRLSVNHYKGRRRDGGEFVYPNVKAWKEQLWFMVRSIVQDANLVLHPPIKVKVSGTFKDKRSTPDMDNLLKVINDAVSDALEIDDKDFANETENLGIGEPELTIVIRGSNEN